MAVGLTENQNNPDVIVNTMVMGSLDIDCAGSSDVTLTDSQANYAQLKFSGVLTGNISIIVPSEANVYRVYNNSTGVTGSPEVDYTITVKVTGTSPEDSGIAIERGKRAVLGCDGSYVVRYSADV